MKVILTQGEASQLPRYAPGAAKGEITFNTDTRELIMHNGDGTYQVAATVVEGPEGGLYMAAPEGYIPIVIRTR